MFGFGGNKSDSESVNYAENPNGLVDGLVDAVRAEGMSVTVQEHGFNVVELDVDGIDQQEFYLIPFEMITGYALKFKTWFFLDPITDNRPSILEACNEINKTYNWVSASLYSDSETNGSKQMNVTFEFDYPICAHTTVDNCIDALVFVGLVTQDAKHLLEEFGTL